MDDLVTWLPAQLDEDEREILRHGPPMPPAFGVTPSRFTTMQAGTTVLMNPRRVLADVAADRAILAAYEEAEAYYRANPSAPAGELHGLLTAIKHRATVYADRPGYRDEWKP